MSDLRKKYLASLVSNGPIETAGTEKEDTEAAPSTEGAQISFELNSLRQFCGMAMNMKSFKKERQMATKRPNYNNCRRRRLAKAKRTKRVQQLGWSR